VRYDLVPGPREWAFTLRLHLRPGRDATQADVARATASATAAAARYVNGPARVLPGTDARMSLSVEFTADPADAHAVVEVVPGTPGPDEAMNQGRWFADAPEHVYAHELVHQLGVRDTHGSPRALLRPAGPRAEAEPGDLMGDTRAEEGEYTLGDHQLAQIVQLAAQHLPPRPELFRGGGDGHRRHTAAEEPDTALDLLPEVNRELLVAGDRETIVESRPGVTVYRAVETEPREVFANGLVPKEPDRRDALRTHIGTTGRTQFVSTTYDPGYVHNNRRWVYTIRPSDTGIDVAETLKQQGLPYTFSWEKEVTFTGPIPTEDIVEVRDTRTGEVIPNPFYRPRT
jgi:scabin-like protein